MSVVFTNYALTALLTNATQNSGGVAGILRGAKVHLFKTAVVPTPNSIVSDFVEADFTDYEEISITWDTPYINGSNQTVITGDTAVFSAGVSPSSQTIYGIFVTDSSGDNLIYAERLSKPIAITIQGNGLSYAPALIPNFATGTIQS